MGETMIELFHDYPQYAVIISLVISVLIALSGVLPSYFLTAANLYFFGLYEGTVLSIVGEALGAWIAFIFYRKGFSHVTRDRLHNYKYIEPLINVKGERAFRLIVALRLMPFMPSGIVTFFSAIGIVSGTTFLIASTIGKVPALILEVLAVYQVLQWGLLGKVILASISIVLLWNGYVWIKKKSK